MPHPETSRRSQDGTVETVETVEPVETGAPNALSSAEERDAPRRAPASAPTAPQQLVQQESQAMGTSVQLLAWTADPPKAYEAFAAALEALQRIEVMMTTWDHPGWPRSEVMQINDHAGGDAVPVSDDTLAVLRAAQDMARYSHGLFDVTFAAMGGLWHFDEDLIDAIPSGAALQQRLKWVDYTQLQLDVAARTARLARPHMRINLGGIAKGYGVDACAAQLRAHGLRDFLVQAGGDMYVAGLKGQVPWKVGIRDPRGAADASYFATATLSDHAFSTAGDYERAFIKDGKRYHHILDPRTGYPATASRSVTLFAPTALLADALDDTVFILGPEAGLALLRDHYPECGAVIVDAHNRVWISDNLRSRVQIIHPPTDGV